MIRSIQAVPYGLKQAISVQAIWLSKLVESDQLCMRIELYDENGDVIDVRDMHMTDDDYMALGQTKTDRVTAIIQRLGFVEITDPSTDSTTAA